MLRLSGLKMYSLLLLFILPGCGLFSTEEETPIIITYPKSILSDSLIEHEIPENPIMEANTIKAYGVPPENIGYIVYDMEKKIVVRKHNNHKVFIPASTTKIPTTVAALNLLGSNFRFKTYLGHTGKIKHGVIKGDLYLKGGGDPLLTVADLQNIINTLKKRGVHKIDGRFFYDESGLLTVKMIDDDMDEDVSYNSGLSALSLDYNTIFAHWEPNKKYLKGKIKKKILKKDGKKGDKNLVKMDIFLTPDLPINKIAQSGKELKENIKFAYKSQGGLDSWQLSPEIDKKGRGRLPVKDAGLYTALMFAKICRMNDIIISKPGEGIMPDNHTIVHTHHSRPLKELIDTTLTYSNNLMAELIYLQTAKHLTGKVLNFEESGYALSSYFASHLKQINWDGFYLKNGSGLTSKNRMSPEQLLAILLFAESKTYAEPGVEYPKSYLSYLPISGWKWSLMRRLNYPNSAFHVWAKTGGINYAISLAGYFFTKSNKKMAFVFFVSHFNRRDKFDRNPERRGKKAMKGVYYWGYKSKKTMDTIITRWIAEL
ncbi:MAG: hypothetical protein GY754_39000 [bacterium]|nr:hypothetical protein [bacterium]